MNETHGPKTMKVIIDKDACRYQKLRIHNVRCIQTDKVVKVTGRLSSDRLLWDCPYIAITVEGVNREIIDTKVSRAICCNKNGFFDVRIFISDIKELCIGLTEEVRSIGIMTVKKGSGFDAV